MNFEQIIIRLGVDASAVQSGLSRVGAYVKGWGVSLVHHLKGHLGAFLGTGFFISALERINEKLLEINHAAMATGASTNFIQGMMQVAAKSGVGFDQITAGLARFNKTLGAAKSGEIDSIKRLADMHVLTGKNSASTLNFTSAIHNLAVRFDGLNDKQKQAFLLSQAFGRNYAAMLPIFEKGAEAIDKMNSGNFFNRYLPGTVGTFQSESNSLKTIGGTISRVVANTVAFVGQGFAGIESSIYRVSYLARGPMAYLRRVSEDIEGYKGKNVKHDEKSNMLAEMQAESEKDGISVEEKKLQILEREIELKEKSSELSAQIADRDKLSVDEMAARARKLTGNRDPLEAFHTVTPRMRTALGIKNLEERAKVQFLLGNDQKSAGLQSEADRLRASNPWMKRMDVNPTLKIETELQRVNQQLEPVSRAAALIKD